MEMCWDGFRYMYLMVFTITAPKIPSCKTSNYSVFSQICVAFAFGECYVNVMPAELNGEEGMWSTAPDGTEVTSFLKVWGAINAIREAGRSWRETCLIEVVIPTHVERSLPPTECGHYTSAKSIGLFRNPFRTNLTPVKPCGVIKSIEWLKN